MAPVGAFGEDIFRQKMRGVLRHFLWVCQLLRQMGQFTDAIPMFYRCETAGQIELNFFDFHDP